LGVRLKSCGMTAYDFNRRLMYKMR